MAPTAKYKINKRHDIFHFDLNSCILSISVNEHVERSNLGPLLVYDKFIIL